MDSADNLDDIDEKGQEYGDAPVDMIDLLTGHKTPSSGIETQHDFSKLRKSHVQEAESDGENVEVEDEDMQTKAFEARESQWNHKLSNKHSEEKVIS